MPLGLVVACKGRWTSTLIRPTQYELRRLYEAASRFGCTPLSMLAESQDGTWVRTRKGITMSADLYPELRSIVEEAEEYITAVLASWG